MRLSKIYWFIACTGLMTVSASFIIGFRHEQDASYINYFINAGLYLVFIFIHMLMTLPAFKRRVYGSVTGSAFERRVYIMVSIITWVGVYFLHKPVPGFAYLSPVWLQFLGTCLLLLCVFAFFEYANFEMMNGFIGMPGTELSHTTDKTAPLMQTGSYAMVRHPMYRAMILLTFSSLLIHPNAAQLFFAIIISLSFIGFVPFEERMLLQARGDEYAKYMEITPYRIIRGIW